MTAWRTNVEPFPADHPCLPGHFPGHPIVPGTLILERVADCLTARLPTLRIETLLSVKFLSPLQPGQPFSIHIDAEGNNARFECRREQTVLASGKLQLAQRKQDG